MKMVTRLKNYVPPALQVLTEIASQISIETDPTKMFPMLSI